MSASAPYQSPSSYDVNQSELDPSTLYRAHGEDGSTVEMKHLGTGHDEVIITLPSTLKKSAHDPEHFKLDPFIVASRKRASIEFQNRGMLSRTTINENMKVTEDGSQFLSTITDPNQLGNLAADLQSTGGENPTSKRFGPVPWTNAVTGAAVWESPCHKVEIQGGLSSYDQFQNEPGNASLEGLIQRVSLSRSSHDRYTPGLTPHKPVPKDYRELEFPPLGVVIGEDQDDESKEYE